jgi:hypothetical protein
MFGKAALDLGGAPPKLTPPAVRLGALGALPGDLRPRASPRFTPRATRGTLPTPSPRGPGGGPARDPGDCPAGHWRDSEGNNCPQLAIQGSMDRVRNPLVLLPCCVAKCCNLLICQDLKSLGFGHAGSIPAPGTKHLQHVADRIGSPWRTGPRQATAKGCRRPRKAGTEVPTVKDGRFPAGRPVAHSIEYGQAQHAPR